MKILMIKTYENTYEKMHQGADKFFSRTLMRILLQRSSKQLKLSS